MMMDCPRCGFSQPKDRFCANCGLDVEHYVEKPAPLLVRLLQNPNLHLSLIVVLLVVMAGYIFYSQRDRLGRQMGALFTGVPLSSRESRDQKADHARNEVAPTPTPKRQMEETGSSAAAAVPADGTDSSEAEKVADASGAKVEVSYWEIPRETLSGLIGSAEKLAESSEGRAYYWSQGTEIAKSVSSSSRRLALSRTMPAQNGAQLSVETPSTASEAFQFGLYFQLTKAEGRDPSIKWESTMLLPPPEAPGEANSQAPVVKSLSELSLNGNASLSGQGLLMLVFEPSNRSPREEYVSKAGDGPWKVFSSEAFRAGASDWVVLLQLH